MYLCIRDRLPIDASDIELEQEMFDGAVIHFGDTTKQDQLFYCSSVIVTFGISMIKLSRSTTNSLIVSIVSSGIGVARF